MNASKRDAICRNPAERESGQRAAGDSVVIIFTLEILCDGLVAGFENGECAAIPLAYSHHLF